MYIGWVGSALLAYPTSERTTGRERLEQRPEEDHRRMHLLVCGYGFVRSLGRRCMVSACNGLLHRGLLPIAQHHHQKKQAAPHSEMDCGHDMAQMMDCAMSCCQTSENPLVTAVAFVLPDATSLRVALRLSALLTLCRHLRFHGHLSLFLLRLASRTPCKSRCPPTDLIGSFRDSASRCRSFGENL